MARAIVFIDSEAGAGDKKIHGLGAARNDRTTFHSASIHDFAKFIDGADFLRGHNIVHHNLAYIRPHLADGFSAKYIDTLDLSPLLFPKRPYHALLKDDKLQSAELNNPLNDAQKAEKLFYDEGDAFYDLSPAKKQIYCCLLDPFEEFRGFFDYVNFVPYRSNVAC